MQTNEYPYAGGIITLSTVNYEGNWISRHSWFRVDLTLPTNRNRYYYYQASTTQISAMERAKKAFLWLLKNESISSQWGVHAGATEEGDLGITMHRVIEYPHCFVPYRYRVSYAENIPVMTVVPFDSEALFAGWAQAIKIEDRFSTGANL